MKWLTLIGLARGCLVNETSDNNGGIIFKIKMKLFLLISKNAGIPVQQFQKPSNNYFGLLRVLSWTNENAGNYIRTNNIALFDHMVLVGL